MKVLAIESSCDETGVGIAELARSCGEATRLLADGGLLLIHEYHPLRRLWAEDTARRVAAHGSFDVASGSSRFASTRSSAPDQRRGPSSSQRSSSA